MISENVKKLDGAHYKTIKIRYYCDSRSHSSNERQRNNYIVRLVL